MLSEIKKQKTKKNKQSRTSNILICNKETLRTAFTHESHASPLYARLLEKVQSTKEVRTREGSLGLIYKNLPSFVLLGKPTLRTSFTHGSLFTHEVQKRSRAKKKTEHIHICFTYAWWPWWWWSPSWRGPPPPPAGRTGPGAASEEALWAAAVGSCPGWCWEPARAAGCWGSGTWCCGASSACCAPGSRRPSTALRSPPAAWRSGSSPQRSPQRGGRSGRGRRASWTEEEVSAVTLSDMSLSPGLRTLWLAARRIFFFFFFFFYQKRNLKRKRDFMMNTLLIPVMGPEFKCSFLNIIHKRPQTLFCFRFIMTVFIHHLRDAHFGMMTLFTCAEFALETSYF